MDIRGNSFLRVGATTERGIVSVAVNDDIL